MTRRQSPALGVGDGERTNGVEGHAGRQSGITERGGGVLCAAWGRRAGHPTLGTAYGDSQGKWGLVQVAPKDRWKAGEMGACCRGTTGVLTPRVETRRWDRWWFRVDEKGVKGR